jgi:hypothetical protein
VHLNTEEAWVVDVYDSFFIYDLEDNKKLYRLNYTMSDAGVEVAGEPQEVTRVTEYRTAQGEFVGNTARKQKRKEKDMDKEKLVDNLISNAGTQWREDDRDDLMQMDEAALAKMAPVENAGTEGEGGDAAGTEGEGEPSAEPKKEDGEEAPVTMEAYVAQAPAEFRDVLINGLAAHNAQKDELIAKITANAGNKFTEEFLATKPLQELQGLAALCGDAAPTTPAGTPPMFYGGQGTLPGGPVGNQGEVTETPLVAPVMNFGSEE